jgi:antitoxin ChpS
LFITKLKKVGGSQMLALPPALLQTMGFSAGDEIEIRVDGDRLVIGAPRKRRQLADLIANCNPSLPLTDEDQAWLADAPVGGEII